MRTHPIRVNTPPGGLRITPQDKTKHGTMRMIFSQQSSYNNGQTTHLRNTTISSSCKAQTTSGTERTGTEWQKKWPPSQNNWKRPRTTISTLDLPPLKHKDNNKEINLYNYTLARERKTTEISKRLREEDVHEIIRGDGIHLTPRGGEITAKIINNLVNNNINNNNQEAQQPTKVTANIPRPQPETTSEKWRIPQKTASTIIGKGGINIRRLQENHHVTIDIHEQEKDSDSLKITVKGQQQNTTNARTEINEIMKNFGRTQHLQKTKARHETECIYYASGYCNKSSQWLPNTPFASISECLVS